MLLLLFLAAAEPPLQAVSPLHLRLVSKDGAYEVRLANNKKTPHRWFRRLDLYVRDAADKPCKLVDTRTQRQRFFADYKTLAPDLEIAIGRITIGGGGHDLLQIDMDEQHCGYLPKGRYWVSAVLRSEGRECSDCTPAQREELQRMWQGVLRSNEVIVQN